MKLLSAALVAAIVFVAGYPAFATDCPPGAKSCKVLILTQDEVQALIGDRMILQTAQQARPLDLGSAVTFMFNKIVTAPDGVVKPDPAPADPSKSVPPAPAAKK